MQQKLNIISNCIIPHNIVLLGSFLKKSMKNNDWKERLNIVYSTNPDYKYEMNDDEEQAEEDVQQQESHTHHIVTDIIGPCLLEVADRKSVV